MVEEEEALEMRRLVVVWVDMAIAWGGVSGWGWVGAVRGGMG